MKTLTFALIATVGILTLTHCKKSNDSKEEFPIVGLWIGSQVPEDGSAVTPLYLSVDLLADSTIQTSGLGGDGNTYYSKGTYSLSGTAFTASVKVTGSYQNGLTQTLTATYHPENGTITGGELVNVGTSYHGSFTLARIN